MPARLAFSPASRGLLTAIGSAGRRPLGEPMCMQCVGAVGTSLQAVTIIGGPIALIYLQRVRAFFGLPNNSAAAVAARVEASQAEFTGSDQPASPPATAGMECTTPRPGHRSSSRWPRRDASRGLGPGLPLLPRGFESSGPPARCSRSWLGGPRLTARHPHVGGATGTRQSHGLTPPRRPPEAKNPTPPGRGRRVAGGAGRGSRPPLSRHPS